MAGITERNQQKMELASRGFSMKYIDEWQPKTVLYRHKASLNVQGEVVRDIGTTLEGVPGNPDYVLRKSKIGLFTWKPNEACECKWCRETDWIAVETGMSRSQCDQCEFVAEAKNSAGVASKLTFHKRAKHNEDV